MTWALVALALALLLGALFVFGQEVPAPKLRAARVLSECVPMDLNHAGWRTWAVLLAVLVLLAVALLLVGQLTAPS